MPRFTWLTARPIAHRGLHDGARGVIENTAGAFTAAIAGGYAIECDLQISADGEAMVHHDDALGRLTEGAGRLAAMTAAALKAVRFKADGEARILTLPELCELVAGRVALLLELKSRFDGDGRLVARTLAVLAHYRGPVAVMSFDPAMMATARRIAPRLPRGIVAERRTGDNGKTLALPAGRRRLAYCWQLARARPDFIAYAAQDLPAPGPWAARRLLRLPLLAWTVRDAEERRRVARFADQIIFEGWRP